MHKFSMKIFILAICRRASIPYTTRLAGGEQKTFRLHKITQRDH